MTQSTPRTVALAVCLVLAVAAVPVAGLVAPAGTDDGAAVSLGADTAPQDATAGRVATGTPDASEEGSDTNWTGGNDSGWSVDTDAAGGMGTGSTADGESTAGEAFASAVAAHDTELEGAVQRRAFDRRLAAAGNGTDRARLLRETVRNAELRLAVLDARRERLRAAYRNGSISRGSYQVALARLTTEARTLRQVLDRADGAAGQLPRTTRTEYGLENATFDELRSRADALGNRSGTTLEGVDFEYDGTLDDPEFDRPEWNESLTDGGDTLNGTDWYTRNGSDTTFENTTTNETEARYPERRMTLLTLDGNATELQGVHDYLADRSDGDREAEEALDCAQDAIDDARVAIDDAGAALDEADPARADDRIDDARAALTTARDCLEQARAALRDDDDSSTSTPTDWQR